jgi:two-component system sensor kinase FixL
MADICRVFPTGRRAADHRASGARRGNKSDMPQDGPFRISRYAAAAALVLAAALARLILDPWLGDREPFALFTLAILAAVLWCGRLPAAVATLLSLAMGAYFLRGRALALAGIVELLAFLAASLGIILIGTALRRVLARGQAGDHDAHRHREQAELVSEELNLLIDGAQGQAIYMLDTEGCVSIWNKGAERLKGWTEEEVLGRPSALFYPADAVASGKPHADLERARVEGRFEEETWHLRKDGTEFLASVAITALNDESGKPRGFALVVADITSQRAVEASLRASERHLRSILSTVPDAMIVIDDLGIIQSFSAAAEKLFGYDSDEIIGSNVSRLMPSPDRERHDVYIRRYLETGERRIIGIGRVVFAQRRDGSTFPMELSIGEAVGDGTRLFTGFIRDITGRRQTEERLQELQSELIHVSRVSAMGTMASTLAHELNQPITAVANYVEAVRDLLAAPDPEDLPMIREALDDAAKETIRAGNIVRRLRDFVSRGEVDKTVEKLPALINEAAVLGLIGAQEKGVRPHFDLDPCASPVLVDRVQIQQVLINLIRNAIEAMAGCERRELSVTTRLDQPGFVRVTVADTGPGVAPEVAANLFTAFVSTKGEGMGLGLSICRTIVEANGGRIWMEPREGGGTQFHFTLPRVEPEIGHAE